jgi:hypothetical protein
VNVVEVGHRLVGERLAGLVVADEENRRAVC